LTACISTKFYIYHVQTVQNAPKKEEALQKVVEDVGEGVTVSYFIVFSRVFVETREKIFDFETFIDIMKFMKHFKATF